MIFIKWLFLLLDDKYVIASTKKKMFYSVRKKK